MRNCQESKHWFNIKTNEHYTDNLIRQHGFSRVINHTTRDNDNLSTDNNNDLMKAAGFVEVYDCGQSSYKYIV